MILPALLAAALAFSSEDAEFAHRTATEFVAACTPREAGTIRGALAASWLLERASVTGADVRRDVFTDDTPRGPRRFVNLYAEFPGNETSRWVVLVSHYDAKAGCPGANDGASTSALLVALANRLVTHRTDGNVMLVWTDAEECQGEHYQPNDGLQGSRHAARYLREKKREVQAVICLDMLGDRDLKIEIPANGTPSLQRIACHAARRIGEPGLVATSEKIIRDDHCAFLDAGFPAIDLIDFEYGPDNAWWHSPDDTSDKLSVESLLKSGRLACELLNILM